MKPLTDKYRKLIGPALQWFTLVALSALVLLNAATDHGVLMAINCFWLGFLFFGMLMGKWIDRKMVVVDELMADLKATEAHTNNVAATFQKAIDEGRVEVVSLVPSGDEIKPPTRH